MLVNEPPAIRTLEMQFRQAEKECGLAELVLGSSRAFTSGTGEPPAPI
jgi:hypothetical protein